MRLQQFLKHQPQGAQQQCTSSFNTLQTLSHEKCTTSVHLKFQYISCQFWWLQVRGRSQESWSCRLARPSFYRILPLIHLIHNNAVRLDCEYWAWRLEGAFIPSDIDALISAERSARESKMFKCQQSVWNWESDLWMSTEEEINKKTRHLSPVKARHAAAKDWGGDQWSGSTQIHGLNAGMTESQILKSEQQYWLDKK